MYLASALSNECWIRCFLSINTSRPEQKWPTVLQPKFTNTFPLSQHDDVIKWKHFPRCWPLMRGIHRSPVNSPQKGQWCGALMFSLICAWMNDWVNTHEAGDSGRLRAHYDVTVVAQSICFALIFVRNIRLKYLVYEDLQLITPAATVIESLLVMNLLCNWGRIFHWRVILFEISINNTQNNNTTNSIVTNHLSPIKYKSRWAVRIERNSSSVSMIS